MALHDELAPPDIPQILRGVPAVIEAWERYLRQWSDLAVETLEVIEAPDDRVVTAMRQSGRVREGGVPIAIHFFNVWTIRAGKVREVEIFRHRAEALEAAGLSE